MSSNEGGWDEWDEEVRASVPASLQMPLVRSWPCRPLTKWTEVAIEASASPSPATSSSPLPRGMVLSNRGTATPSAASFVGLGSPHASQSTATALNTFNASLRGYRRYLLVAFLACVALIGILVAAPRFFGPSYSSSGSSSSSSNSNSLSLSSASLETSPLAERLKLLENKLLSLSSTVAQDAARLGVLEAVGEVSKGGGSTGGGSASAATVKGLTEDVHNLEETLFEGQNELRTLREDLTEHLKGMSGSASAAAASAGTKASTVDQGEILERLLSLEYKVKDVSSGGKSGEGGGAAPSTSSSSSTEVTQLKATVEGLKAEIALLKAWRKTEEEEDAAALAASASSAVSKRSSGGGGGGKGEGEEEGFKASGSFVESKALGGRKGAVQEEEEEEEAPLLPKSPASPPAPPSLSSKTSLGGEGPAAITPPSSTEGKKASTPPLRGGKGSTSITSESEDVAPDFAALTPSTATKGSKSSLATTTTSAGERSAPAAAPAAAGAKLPGSTSKVSGGKKSNLPPIPVTLKAPEVRGGAGAGGAGGSGEGGAVSTGRGGGVKQSASTKSPEDEYAELLAAASKMTKGGKGSGGSSGSAGKKVEDEVEQSVSGGEEGEVEGPLGGEGVEYSGLGESSGEAVV